MINNILKKIEKANEVQKVELEKHEVELALIDDFKQLKSKAILESDVILDDYKQITQLSTNLSSKIKLYVELISDLSNVSDNINLKYKELGLDFTKDSNYKDYRRAFENQKNILDIQSKIKAIK